VILDGGAAGLNTDLLIILFYFGLATAFWVVVSHYNCDYTGAADEQGGWVDVFRKNWQPVREGAKE